MENKFKLYELVYAYTSTGEHEASIIEITPSGMYRLRWADGNLSAHFYYEHQLADFKTVYNKRNGGPSVSDFVAERLKNYAGPS